MENRNLPQLEKGSRKYLCPSCNKKSFVYYRTSANDIIDESVGRCDRVDNCGYHLPPKEWYKNHPEQSSQTYTKDFKKPQTNSFLIKSTTKISYIPLKYIYESAKTRNNNLIYFLLDYFEWDHICAVTDTYLLGCTKDRAVLYPMIDHEGKCRTAKIQQYNKDSGKRVKGQSGAINWVHAILKKRGELSKDFNLSLCLFGLHLIRSASNNGKTICICESEKSAIIAALCLPEYVWMASGALEWLNVEKLKPLKGRKVLLFPDTSSNNYALDKWTDIAQQANKQDIEVSVSTLLQEKCTPEEKQQGFDIGDMLINGLTKKVMCPSMQNRQSESAAQTASTEEYPSNPTAKEYSLLSLMEKFNPFLNDLVKCFDLVPVTLGA